MTLRLCNRSNYTFLYSWSYSILSLYARTRTKEEGRGAWDTAAKIPRIMEIGTSVGNGEACADMIKRMLNESLFGGCHWFRDRTGSCLNHSPNLWKEWLTSCHHQSAKWRFNPFFSRRRNIKVKYLVSTFLLFFFLQRHLLCFCPDSADRGRSHDGCSCF